MVTAMNLYLSDFRLVRPTLEHQQENILSWVAAAHTQAESSLRTTTFDAPSFEKELHERLCRIGKGKVKTRGAEHPHIGHTNWEGQKLLNSSIGEKTAVFSQAVDQFFNLLYPPDDSLPSNLIHVTCTGYLSPSGAQKLVSKRDAGRTTTVTHAYHMGCYASIPALRIAEGFLAHPKHTGKKDFRADIVHTELCSLHMDPFAHSTEQLVIQSLFGDGCIRYSLSASPSSASFTLLALKEMTLPNSSEAMKWQPASWGMQMSLKKEVPLHIAKSIEPALEDLASEAGLSLSSLQQDAIFAIHPGGPKIIETIAKCLHLQPHQYQHTYDVLERYGNMSSATLPHIWAALLKDENIPSGTTIVSMAFGPGLTIAASLMEKQVL